MAREELREQNEQLLMAQQLHEAEKRRYWELSVFAPGHYLATDAHGQIRGVNQAAAGMLGETGEALVDNLLAASLSHEINNPLQSVIGCLGLSRSCWPKEAR